MFALQNLRKIPGVNVPSTRDPQYTPMRFNVSPPNEQSWQRPYDPPAPGDYVSREGLHNRAFTISIDPWLSVAAWPNLPTVNPGRRNVAGMAPGHWSTTDGRKNIAGRGNQSYGSLTQLYPHIDTAAQ